MHTHLGSEEDILGDFKLRSCSFYTSLGSGCEAKQNRTDMLLYVCVLALDIILQEKAGGGKCQFEEIACPTFSGLCFGNVAPMPGWKAGIAVTYAKYVMVRKYSSRFCRK